MEIVSKNHIKLFTNTSKELNKLQYIKKCMILDLHGVSDLFNKSEELPKNEMPKIIISYLGNNIRTKEIAIKYIRNRILTEEILFGILVYVKDFDACKNSKGHFIQILENKFPSILFYFLDDSEIHIQNVSKMTKNTKLFYINKKKNPKYYIQNLFKDILNKKK